MALLNKGPPKFVSELTALIILAGNNSTYKLPEIEDPDSDRFNLNIDLQSTIPFAKIVNNSIYFSPMNKDVKITPYIIKIVLTDENSFPKSKEYYLSVTVNPITPVINNTLES